MSGFSLADVVVHRNSAEPARLGAAAFTKGSQIHVAPGQERHLPHEAWHVVQQKQGRVWPTLQLKNGVAVNDHGSLEREADEMSAAAMELPARRSATASAMSTRALAKAADAGAPRTLLTGPSFCGVVQRMKLTQEQRAEFEQHRKELDHFDEVRRHSLSIPPKLVSIVPDFGSRFFAIEDRVDQILTLGQATSVEDIDNIRAEMLMLRQSMNLAKDLAQRKSGHVTSNRPPSDPRGIGDKRVPRAKREAQATLLPDLVQNAEDSIAALHNLKATFYVIGKSANGQGDTAFVVRVTALLTGAGLTAVPYYPPPEDGKASSHVKDGPHRPSPSAEHGGKQTSVRSDSSGGLSKDPLETFLEKVRPGDFVIEGPLADEVPSRKEKVGRQGKLVSTLLQAYHPELSNFRSLRLYEYGTITYKGGQAAQNPDRPISAISNTGNIGHAYLGMGYGEIGALYSSDKQEQPLEGIFKKLEDEGPSDMRTDALQIWRTLQDHPNAKIFIGYASQQPALDHWILAVGAAMRGQSAIVIGVGGGGRSAKPMAVDSAAANVVIVRVKRIPAEVMGALQRIAEPFTLATGNYSLSESIEKGLLPTYEVLPHTGGVSEDLAWHVENACKKLKIRADLASAFLALAKATPEQLQGLDKHIALAVDNSDEVKKVMAYIKAQTDAKANLLARLARIGELPLGGGQGSSSVAAAAPSSTLQGGGNDQARNSPLTTPIHHPTE